MVKEMIGKFNKMEIFRSGVKRFSYKSLIVITNKKERTIELDAKRGAEINQVILDAIEYLNSYDLDSMILNFNGVKLPVHKNSDIKKLSVFYFMSYADSIKPIKTDSYI